MDDRIQEFRSSVRKLGGPGRSWRYPQVLRDLAVSYFVAGQVDGQDLGSAAADLGVSETTLDRWVSSSGRERWQGGLQEVVLAGGAPPSPLSVLTPEVSHEAVRCRERQMRKFKLPGHCQRFLSVHSVVGNLFRVGRQKVSAANYRLLRDRAFGTWRKVALAA